MAFWPGACISRCRTTSAPSSEITRQKVTASSFPQENSGTAASAGTTSSIGSSETSVSHTTRMNTPPIAEAVSAASRSFAWVLSPIRSSRAAWLAWFAAVMTGGLENRRSALVEAMSEASGTCIFVRFSPGGIGLPQKV